MRKIFTILAGVAVCGVGAYGFAHDLKYWGFWLIVGTFIIIDAS